MKTVTINPSIAAIVNIDNVGKLEIVPIYFTAEANWVGTYEFKLWNSNKKNSETTIATSPITVVAALMTLTVNPTNWGAASGTYYYEIVKTEDKRVVFKGNLNIIQ